MITETDLPEDLARQVRAQVQSGRFPNLEEVLRAAFRALEAHEQTSAEWDEYLRGAFERGRGAVARGEFTTDSPAQIVARACARVETQPL